MSGHQRFTKTYRAIRERFSWKGLKEDVLQHVRECEVLDGHVTDDKYRVMDEIIYYRDRIFLTEGSQLKKKILQASHDSRLVGH